MTNSLQQVYKKSGILAFVATIWLLSDFILALWMDYIGLPILGKIESTCINDLCVLIIMFMFLWFLWKNKNQREKHFLLTNIGLCLLLGGGVLYFYPRFANTASFTLFYNFPILAYADVFPFCIILSFFNKKWRKSQEDESDKKDDSIKDAINFYLKKDTNYAIMIANDWGTGKTYYWKNVLAPMILKEESYKPIYISTFGIQSIEELHSKIIEEIHPIFKGRITKMLMSLCNWGLRVFGANLNSRETQNVIRYMNVDWNKYVICIDDFERIAKEESIVCFMGYLNELIEHYHTKMIFIANEKEIKDEKYKEYKEKLIRHTHLYSPNMKDIILEYANDKTPKNPKLAFYLEENVDYIINICNKANSINLRTLFFALEVFENIFAFVEQQKLKNEYEKRVIDYFLFLSFMYSIEYKRNNIHLLKTIDTKFIRDAIYRKWLNSISDNISSKGKMYTEEQQKQIKLIELYYGLGVAIEIYQSKACLEFVSNGYFSEHHFKTEIVNYLNSIKRGQISHEEDLLNRLKCLWNIEDEEMDSNIGESLSLIEKGKISLKLYPSFWVALMRIKDGHFATIDKDISKLLLMFKKGIEISRKTAQYIPNMENYYTMEDCDYGDNETYKEIRDLVLGYNNEIYLVEKQDNLKAKVKDCTFEVLEELCSLEIPIESIITSQEFFDEIKKVTNNKKGDYINFLRKRSVTLLSKYDKGFLMNLKSFLDNYLEINSKDCVSKKYMVLLLKTINEQLGKIERLCHQ